MTAIDTLYETLRPALRGVSARELRGALRGLEPAFAQAVHRRTQLTIRRLRFGGAKEGDFHFYPGVNVLRAGNDTGKSSILKLIHYCLTGKNDLKKDVNRWIEHVELAFELDGVPHAVLVDKSRRPRGRLVRGTLEVAASAETLLAFKNGKEMQSKLETFFNEAFGLRPLMGTQKDARKGSDALLDSTTSYRAYFRGMYINQNMGYTDLLTDGVPYGNLFMKVLGMLLGLRGLDAYFAVEARLAHVENALGKEERYHRRVEEALELRDLATVDEELKKLEGYVDELKMQRTAHLVRATSDDLDRRLAELTQRLLELDAGRQQAAHDLQESEAALEVAQSESAALEEAIAGRTAVGAVEPVRCPVCETAIRERQRHPQPESGRCVLCHEDMPPERDDEAFLEAARTRLGVARRAAQKQRRAVDARRAVLAEIEVKAGQVLQQKGHLQAQLRSAYQGVREVEKEIEIETRYLGRLEAERDQATRAVAEDGGTDIKRLLKRKKILDAVLSHLRTREAENNERRKRAFGRRVQDYCTTIGFPGLEEVSLDARLKPRIRQNRTDYNFEELSPGERVRFVLAFYLALAITTGEDISTGLHPGLLLIDSPGKEEMVHKDFEAVVKLLSLIEQKHAANLQTIVATTIPAIRGATPMEKQTFIERDDQPLF